MKKHIALMTILALGGCGSQEDKLGVIVIPGNEVEQGDGFETVNDGVAIPPALSEEAHDPKDIQMSFSAIDAVGEAIALGGCRLFSRNVGDHTFMRRDDVFNPVCANDEDGVTRLPIDSNSEVVFAMSAEGYPNTLAHLTTSEASMDISNLPYRLLSDASIAAAFEASSVLPVSNTSTVVVETHQDGVSYELLLHTSDQGPDAIYLDADGNIADSAQQGGWALFANVSQGLHSVSFGHAELECEQLGGLGWASWQEGTTGLWTIVGYTTHINAIGCTD